ncbi:hypothetical protein [Sessilibacter sp. MAH4]
MFYVPYKFKSQDEPTTPKGPNFSRAPRIDISINGTMISLKVPRHRTSLRAGPFTSKRQLNLSDSHFDYYDSGISEWKVYKFLSRIWDFYGHNFMGGVGNLGLVGHFMYLPTQIEGTSFFHPTFFENTILDYLHDFYCEHHDRFEIDEPYRWLYQAPVNWQVLNFGEDVNGVQFDVVKDNDDSTGYQRTYIFIPVSNNFILKFYFDVEKNINVVNDIKKDEWINPQPFIDLREQIIGSIKVELSEDAKKQRELALQDVENPKLSETFAPIDWPKDGILKEKFDIENDDGWGEYS